MRPLIIRVADAANLPENFADDLRSVLADELGIDSADLDLELRKAPGVPLPGEALYLLYLHGQDVSQIIGNLAKTLAPHLTAFPPKLAEAFIYAMLYDLVKVVLRKPLDKLRRKGIYPRISPANSESEC